MLGLIAGPLNRAAFGRDVVDFNADDASETNTGHFILALDIARFLPLEDYKAEVDRHVRELKKASACRASTKSACRASGAATAARNDCATVCRSRRRWWRSSTDWRGSLGIKPLNQRTSS